jgi:hypothetical protein
MSQADENGESQSQPLTDKMICDMKKYLFIESMKDAAENDFQEARRNFEFAQRQLTKAKEPFEITDAQSKLKEAERNYLSIKDTFDFFYDEEFELIQSLMKDYKTSGRFSLLWKFVMLMQNIEHLESQKVKATNVFNDLSSAERQMKDDISELNRLLEIQKTSFLSMVGKVKNEFLCGPELNDYFLFTENNE